MTKATLCDSCGIRIDKNWNGVPLTVTNQTGTKPSKVHLCLGCHTEIRDELYELLLDDGTTYEHPQVMNE